MTKDGESLTGAENFEENSFSLYHQVVSIRSSVEEQQFANGSNYEGK